jgi:hypothetical protein
MWENFTEQSVDSPKCTATIPLPSRCVRTQQMDYLPRRTLYKWFLRTWIGRPAYLSLIVFTYKVGFSRDGITNFCNQDVLAHENSHGTVHSKQQQLFSLEVCDGTGGNRLLRPYFLALYPSGAVYHFTQNIIPELLQSYCAWIKLSFIMLLHQTINKRQPQIHYN